MFFYLTFSSPLLCGMPDARHAGQQVQIGSYGRITYRNAQKTEKRAHRIISLEAKRRARKKNKRGKGERRRRCDREEEG